MRGGCEEDKWERARGGLEGRRVMLGRMETRGELERDRRVRGGSEREEDEWERAREEL